MLKDLRDRWTFFSILIEHQLDELLRRPLSIFKSIKLPGGKTLQYLLGCLLVKRDISINHFIKYDTQSPNVYFFIIFSISQQLWRHIIETATISLTSSQPGSHSKINYFRVHILIQKYCLRFQISVNKLPRMDISNGQAYSSENRGDVMFFNLFAANLFVQISSRQKLKNDKEAFFMIKILYDFDDVGMADLSQKLDVLDSLKFGSQFKSAQLFCVAITKQLTSSQLSVTEYGRVFFVFLYELVFLHLLLFI